MMFGVRQAQIVSLPNPTSSYSVDRTVPHSTVNAYMQDVFKLNLPVDVWDVERLNRAVKLYTQHGRDKAYNMMRKSRLADFNPIIVSIGIRAF